MAAMGVCAQAEAAREAEAAAAKAAAEVRLPLQRLYNRADRRGAVHRRRPSPHTSLLSLLWKTLMCSVRGRWRAASGFMIWMEHLQQSGRGHGRCHRQMYSSWRPSTRTVPALLVRRATPPSPPRALTPPTALLPTFRPRIALAQMKLLGRYVHPAMLSGLSRGVLPRPS